MDFLVTLSPLYILIGGALSALFGALGALIKMRAEIKRSKSTPRNRNKSACHKKEDTHAHIHGPEWATILRAGYPPIPPEIIAVHNQYPVFFSRLETGLHARSPITTVWIDPCPHKQEGCSCSSNKCNGEIARLLCVARDLIEIKARELGLWENG